MFSLNELILFSLGQRDGIISTIGSVFHSVEYLTEFGKPVGRNTHVPKLASTFCQFLVVSGGVKLWSLLLLECLNVDIKKLRCSFAQELSLAR